MATKEKTEGSARVQACQRREEGEWLVDIAASSIDERDMLDVTLVCRAECFGLRSSGVLVCSFRPKR